MVFIVYAILSQSSLFKTVLDRNDELIQVISKLMDELRLNNNQHKAMLSENQGLMADLKVKSKHSYNSSLNKFSSVMISKVSSWEQNFQ